MLFRRRTQADFRQRIFTLLWPRRSFWRSANYFAKRILRLAATPHAIAAGVAAGVFASFLPFVGFHLVTAAIVAWCMRGNLIASALGTAVGNPLTFPFIWAATFGLGRLLLDGPRPDAQAPIQLVHLLSEFELGLLWEPILKPMTVGGGILGVLFGAIFYFLTRGAAAAFHARRRDQFAGRIRFNSR